MKVFLIVMSFFYFCNLKRITIKIIKNLALVKGVDYTDDIKEIENIDKIIRIALGAWCCKEGRVLYEFEIKVFVDLKNKYDKYKKDIKGILEAIKKPENKGSGGLSYSRDSVIEEIKRAKIREEDFLNMVDRYIVQADRSEKTLSFLTSAQRLHAMMLSAS